MRFVALMGFGMAVLIGAGSAMAQTAPAAAPSAGSGKGGPVGPSVSTPTKPTGKAAPGTPSGTTQAGQTARDEVGQKVIGHTVTPPSQVPGNTGGQGTGTTK